MAWLIVSTSSTASPPSCSRCIVSVSGWRPMARSSASRIVVTAGLLDARSLQAYALVPRSRIRHTPRTFGVGDGYHSGRVSDERHRDHPDVFDPHHNDIEIADGGTEAGLLPSIPS